MPNTVLNFEVSDEQARAAFSRLQRELSELEDESRSIQREAHAASEAIDRLGDRSRTTARDIDRLGDEAQQSAAQIVQLDTAARRNNATAAAEATTYTENFARTLAKLKANAEGIRDALTGAFNVQQVGPNFQEAIAASEAYYNARIAKAKAALAQETEDTEAFNQLQAEIFALQRQRLQAHGQLETERQRLLEQVSQQRIDAANAASNAEVEGFKASTQAAKAYTDQLQRQIDAIPRIQGPEAQYGSYTSQLRQDFADTEQQGHNLLSVMREIAQLSFGRLDLEARIPDPDLRQQQIDDQIAAQVSGAQTLLDIRQDAAEQGSQFLNSVLRREEREVQRSINANARAYKQFANLVSNTFLDLATGRTQNFETVATAFIQQSIRIIARAFIEHQIRLRLDNQLTAARIANIKKVAAAQSAAGAGGLGNLAGLGNLSGLGRFGNAFGGGGFALGAASLLFPTEIKNLTTGIKGMIGGLLSNVASIPDKVFSPQHIYLKIGDNEIKNITDIQRELVDENRL